MRSLSRGRHRGNDAQSDVRHMQTVCARSPAIGVHNARLSLC